MVGWTDLLIYLLLYIKNVWIERKLDGWMVKINRWMVGRKTKI